MGPLDRLLRLFGLDFEIDLQSPPFHRITPELVLGSRPAPETVAALRDEGVAGVVSCLPASEAASMAFLADDFHTWFIPVHDGMHEDIGAGFPTFFDALDATRAEGRLLVHCEVGVSRSATLAVAHVMRSTDQRFFDAYLQVRSRRPQVLPNIGFATALQRFEHQVRAPEPVSSLARYLVEVCRVPADVSVVQEALEAHDFDAYEGIRAVFGGEIPRVVQGVRLA